MDDNFANNSNLELDYIREVRSVYPNAQVFKINGSYCILEYKPSYEYKLKYANALPIDAIFYCRWQDSPDLAWRAAWERIMYDMLHQFES